MIVREVGEGVLFEKDFGVYFYLFLSIIFYGDRELILGRRAGRELSFGLEVFSFFVYCVYRFGFSIVFGF